MAAKRSTPSYVLTLPLKVEKNQLHHLEKRFETARRLYNACLREAEKRLRVMRESKAYRRARKLPASTSAERKARAAAFQSVNQRFRFEEYALHDFVKPMQRTFKHLIDSQAAQKLATRAFDAVQKVQFGEAKKLSFKRFGEMRSVEGKQNTAGIRYKEGMVHWLGLSMAVRLKEGDAYAHLALKDRVKYCRLLRRWMKGQIRYYVQLVLEGTPPVKYNRNGQKGRRGTGKVGIDIGTQTVAIVSNAKASLLELAPSVINVQKDIRLVQRAMDRSKRAMNPGKYDSDGAIKKTMGKWVFSKRYHQLKGRYRELSRVNASRRRQDHCRLANELIEQGDQFFIETMSFKALQKRAKETAKNSGGRFKSKKRFGRSLARKAPALFVSILELKLKAISLEVQYIHTAKVKASQYNHETDQLVKKKLSDRWNVIEGERIQRDLYSAFLIKHVTDTLDQIDRPACIADYPLFKQLHDREIERIQTTVCTRIPSFGF
ncbi:transposase [Bacillus aerolatus]|uniref:Transposase n=1 Tax=Bacillus aerolatus TaxID=2653354 RepID=A0A6I1FSQ2_9BACI|nr:transposase [Bacillus aerolatus]KAB7705286.1 transposase [Bacillus aerolatus]